MGIDLVPFKTCSYDCIYCQLGRTTNRTIERKEYAPLDEVLEELESRLAAANKVIDPSQVESVTLLVWTETRIVAF